MNLRQKYKKAKQRLAYLEKLQIPVVAEIINPYNIVTLNVTREVPYNELYLIDNIKREIADQFVNMIIDDIIWSSELNPITGGFTVQAKLKVAAPIKIDKDGEKYER